MLLESDLVRASRVARRWERLGPAENQSAASRRWAAHGAVLAPLQTVLAAEDQGKMGRVNGGRDLSDLGVSGVESRHVVPGGVPEGRVDSARIGPGSDKE